MNETRVNLQHLLEDIRDSYTSPLEEVILTELVANALDGKATKINFEIDTEKNFIRCCDNGNGMKRAGIKNYHNIAASTKTRGSGIGFAGVGAKLSLLIAKEVVTESKGGYGSQCATSWNLSGPYKAPWKFIPFSGCINTPRGTAVAIYFTDNQSHLLKTEFVEATILKHFYPLLNTKIYNDLLKFFYKKPIEFFINNQKVTVPENNQGLELSWFNIRQGKSRVPIGVGYLTKTSLNLSWLEKVLGKSTEATSLKPGLYISTFGKIIKGGWEWLGILPKNSESLAGIVEIPAMAEILTTNKNDFLSDSASLKKYYKYRKAVQEAVLPILENLGEGPSKQNIDTEKIIKPLNKAIDQTLNNLLGDFPELESLIGHQTKKTLGQEVKKEQEIGSHSDPVNNPLDEAILADNQTTPLQEKKINTPSGKENKSLDKPIRAKKPGIQIVLGEITDSTTMLLGRIIDETLTINTKHPAWSKAKHSGLMEYHILLSVALVLSEFLDSQKPPQEFLNRFLCAWGEQGQTAKTDGMLF